MKLISSKMYREWEVRKKSTRYKVVTTHGLCRQIPQLTVTTQGPLLGNDYPVTYSFMINSFMILLSNAVFPPWIIQSKRELTSPPWPHSTWCRQKSQYLPKLKMRGGTFLAFTSLQWKKNEINNYKKTKTKVEGKLVAYFRFWSLSVTPALPILWASKFASWPS